MNWLKAAGERLNASKGQQITIAFRQKHSGSQFVTPGVPIKALSIICSFLKKHHNNVPDLFTSMESGVDYASSVDQEQFSALVEAMKSVGAGTTKTHKSSREKTYACKVILSEKLATRVSQESVVIEVWN